MTVTFQSNCSKNVRIHRLHSNKTSCWQSLFLVVCHSNEPNLLLNSTQ